MLSWDARMYNLTALCISLLIHSFFMEETDYFGFDWFFLYCFIEQSCEFFYWMLNKKSYLALG